MTGIAELTVLRIEWLVILLTQNSQFTKTGGPALKIFAHGSQRNMSHIGEM